MISVRGGLCRNLWAEVSLPYPLEKRLAKRNDLVNLWNSATATFVATYDYHPLMEKADKAFLCAAYSKNSAQAMIVNIFWDAVKQQKAHSSLVCRADTLVSTVEIQISEKLSQAVRFTDKAASRILWEFKTLKFDVSQIFARCHEEQLVKDYAQYQVDIWTMCQAALHGSEQLFHDLTAELISQNPEFDAFFKEDFWPRVKEWQETVLGQWKEEIPNPELEVIIGSIIAGFDDQAERFGQLSSEDASVKQLMDFISPFTLDDDQGEVKAKEELVEKLWQEANVEFVKNNFHHALWKRAEEAFVLACFGADSPQYLLVAKFWEMVKDPSGGLSLLCRVENEIASLFQSTQLAFKQQIQQILTSLESATEKANRIFSIFDSLKKEVCRCLEIKDVYRSKQEKIMHEYAQFRANLCVAYTLVECGADKLFATLSSVYKEERDRYVTARKALLEGCLPLEQELVKKSDFQGFYSTQLEETRWRFDHLNEIARNVYKEAEEIEAFQKQLGTPFFSALRQWRNDVSATFQKLLSQKESTLSLAYLSLLIKHELEKRIALFEPFAAKK